MPVLAALALLAAAISLLGSGEFVTLAWDPSPDPGIARYTLYWGASPGQYSWSTNVWGQNWATIDGLATNTTYWFAVTATSTNQLESDFSNEVGWPKPIRPQIHSSVHVELTPVVLRSTNGVAWFQTNLWPTLTEATNSVELFQGLRIERKEFVTGTP
jgi:hypothetical protein